MKIMHNQGTVVMLKPGDFMEFLAFVSFDSGNKNLLYLITIISINFFSLLDL